VLYALWEVAVVGLINKPVIAVIELILHTRKEDLAIGLAQRILVISRDIQTFGLLSAIESRPKQVIWLHLLGRWQPESKDTVHWGDDDATVFGSGEVGFCRVGDCLGKKVRSAHSWKERVSS
jgi:hypothetical protein